MQNNGLKDFIYKLCLWSGDPWQNARQLKYRALEESCLKIAVQNKWAVREYEAHSYRFICRTWCRRSKVKWSRYMSGVVQRLGRGIALLFHDRGTRRGWVFSSTSRPHFTPGNDPVPILQEVGWVPGPVWTGGKSRPHRDSNPDRPARSQLLYRLSYPAHAEEVIEAKIWN